MEQHDDFLIPEVIGIDIEPIRNACDYFTVDDNKKKIYQLTTNKNKIGKTEIYNDIEVTFMDVKPIAHAITVLLMGKVKNKDVHIKNI